MGKIISFWSPCGKAGRTTLIFSILNRYSELLDNKMKILTIDASQGAGGGIFEISGFRKYGLSMEDIVNLRINPGCSVKTEDMLARSGRLYFLKSKGFDGVYYGKYGEILSGLIEEFRKTFGLIIFDAPSGRGSSLTDFFTRQSEYLISVYMRDTGILDKPWPLPPERTIPVINFCDNETQAGLKEFLDALGIRRPFMLPYCGKLQGMAGRGLAKYYLQHDTPYNRSAENIAHCLADRLGLSMAYEKKAREEKRSFIMRLLLQ